MTRDLANELAAILPTWVTWAGPIIAATVFGLIVAVLRLFAVTSSLRRASREQLWTERARHVHVARVAAMASTILLPVLAAIVATAYIGPLGPLPRWLAAVVFGSIGAVVGFRASAAVERHIHGPSNDSFLHSVLGVVMGFGPIVLLLGLGWFSPDELADWRMLPWLVAVVGVVYAWLRAPLLMLRTPLATDADDRTTDIVSTAAASLSMTVDRVIEFRTRQLNAFAFPWLGVLGFTTGALKALDDEELEAITFHELAHLGESAGLTRLRQAQLYALVPIVATRPLAGSLGYAGPVLAVVGFVVVTEIVRRRGLAAEHASDAAAIESIHHSEVLGRALEKTYRLGMIPAVLPRATHGQLHERLEAAGLEPEFDPPAQPPRLRSLTAVVAIVLILAAGWFSPWLVYAVTDDGSFAPTYLATALPIYGSDPFETLAFEAELDEQWDDAAVFYEAAAEVSRNDPYLRSEAVRMWAFAGDCLRAEVSAAGLDPSTHAEDFRYAQEIIDWCEVTGGR